MPEYPDVTVYVEALRPRLVGARLVRMHLLHPFLLRTTDPPPAAFERCAIESVRRIGKQIAIGFQGSLFMVIHLMIAGRLRWVDALPGAGAPERGDGAEARPAAERGVKLSLRLPRRIALASFELSSGTLHFTEAGTKKRASLHLVRSEESLAAFDRGGLELVDASPGEFRAALLRENHTLKRSLTDPRLFSGVGNAYSDEILHRARLSPFKQSSQLTAQESERLLEACRAVLLEWTERLRREAAGQFPSKVTAFHKEMAVLGKYGEPCPACGTPIQRIVYAENECNYCPTCQTEGRLLADRSLSRLLKGDWPATIEELEAMRRGRG